LLTAGLHLRFDSLREHLRPLSLGLGYMLLRCPALVVLGLRLHGGGSGMSSQVTVIEPAMPPMIGAAVVASQQASLAPRFVALMIGVGLPVGSSTAPL